MNTEYIIANLSFIIFPIALTGVAFFLLILVLAIIFKWVEAKKVAFVGLIVFSLLGVIPLIDLIQRDWSVAECLDANGNVTEDKVNCQFP